MGKTNKDIVHLLRSVAAVYILTGANPFRIIAYEKAADTVEHLNRELMDIWESGELIGISGIGPSIASHLDEYFKKNEGSYLMRTLQKIPAPIFELMKVPGIGPKRAYKLVSELKLQQSKKPVDDLKKAALDNKIAQVESFGERSQSEILNSIKLYKRSQSKEERMSLAYAHALATEIVRYLKQNRHVLKVDALGSLRRGVVTVGDIDIAVVCKEKYAADVVAHFISNPKAVRIRDKGAKKAAITLSNGNRVDLRVSLPDEYGSMLQYFTGSKAHNIQLREYAQRMGFSLSEYGIKKLQAASPPNRRTSNKLQKTKKFKTEKEFYEFLGLQYIPPEIREGTDEIAFARKKKIPKLVELSDIKCDLQIHSSYNLEPSHDAGANTFKEILEKARVLKYGYVAFTDHNPSVGNHTEEEVVKIMKRRYEVLEKLKQVERTKFFISCEVDVLPSGKIALPLQALEFVDMILIAVHSSFRMDKDSMTKRLLKALSFPKVKVLAHPTARLLNKRAEIDADWTRIFDECAKRDIAIEINAHPERLDLPDALVRRARGRGVKFALGTDAHATEHMDNMHFGVAVARRGWLERKHIVNTQSYSKISKWIFKKK